MIKHAVAGRFAAIAAVMVSLSASAGVQTVRYVKADNPGAAEPYDTEANAAGDIQTAIDFCGEEEKIVVLKGIYNTTEAVNVNKKLEVVGATGNPEDVVIHNTVSGYRCLKVTKAGAFVASMGIVLDAARVYPAEWLILAAVFVISVLPTMLCTLRMARRDGVDA